MDKGESEEQLEESLLQHQQELEHQEFEDLEEKLLSKIEDEIQLHLATAVDVHKTLKFLAEYMRQSKQLNKSQHTAIMQFTNKAINKRSIKDGR